MAQLNPYAAPQASLVESPGAKPATRRSWWALLRFIPVFYFGSFAVLGLAGTILYLGLTVWLSVVRTNSVNLNGPWMVQNLIRIPGMAALGIGGYFTTRAWYACRWRRAVRLSVLFFAMIGVGALFSKYFKLGSTTPRSTASVAGPGR